MTVLTAAELTALRDEHPHVLKYYMSVFVPEVVYCGTVTGSPAWGARVITVVDVSGDITDILEGYTVYVGTSCGDYSISKRRYRSRSGQDITLDENTVDWNDGDYITIVNSRLLWSVYPYINDTTLVFYKDRDIVYTNQNTTPNPVAIAGCHEAAFLDGATVSFTLDASDSYAIANAATISTYLWECSSGVIANPNIATTTITFNAYGQYWIKLTVTDSNGKTQSTYRVKWVHSRSGANAPYYDFSLERLSSSWSTGGRECGVAVTSVADPDDIPDNALVIIWSEAYYNGIEKHLYNNTRTIFAGYIREESIIRDFANGSVTFSLATIQDVMKNTNMSSVSLEYYTNPNTWYRYRYLTVARAVHHYWKWHSTLFDICDVFLPVEDTRYISACDEFEEGNIYEVVDTFTYQHGNFSHVCCSMYGAVHVEKDYQMYDIAERAAKDILFTIEKEDIKFPIDIIRNTEERLSYTIISGTYFSGSGNDDPIISQAPGEVPHSRGSSDTLFERIVQTSQADSNMLVGRVMAVANREIMEIRLVFGGNYLQVLDVVPQNWVVVNIVAGDTKRGIVYSGRCLIRDIQIEISGGACTTTVVLEPECFGPDGIAGPYDDDITDVHDDPAPPTYPPWSVECPSVVIVSGSRLTGPPDAPYYECGIYITYNFNDATPTWTSLVGDLPLCRDTPFILEFDRVSGSKLYLASAPYGNQPYDPNTEMDRLWVLNDIYNLTVNWTSLLTSDTLRTLEGYDPEDQEPWFSNIAANPKVTDDLLLICAGRTDVSGTWRNITRRIYRLTYHDGFPSIAQCNSFMLTEGLNTYSTERMAQCGDLSYGEDKALYVECKRYDVAAYAYNFVINREGGYAARANIVCNVTSQGTTSVARVGYTDKLFMMIGGRLYLTLDNGVTNTLLISPLNVLSGRYRVDIDSTGLYALLWDSVGGFTTLFRSLNTSLTSWGVASVYGAPIWARQNPYGWIALSGNAVYFTYDFGYTWTQKSFALSGIATLNRVIVVK